MRHVFYLHGFASSPASSKAALLAARLRPHGLDLHCPDFNEPDFETMTVTRMLAQVDAAQVERMEANLESLENLEEKLAEQGQSLDAIPHVMQYNKRDLPNIVPMVELQASLNKRGVPWCESCATKGIGVFETLKAAAKLVLTDLKRKMGG